MNRVSSAYGYTFALTHNIRAGEYNRYAMPYPRQKTDFFPFCDCFYYNTDKCAYRQTRPDWDWYKGPIVSGFSVWGRSREPVTRSAFVRVLILLRQAKWPTKYTHSHSFICCCCCFCFFLVFESVRIHRIGCKNLLLHPSTGQVNHFFRMKEAGCFIIIGTVLWPAVGSLIGLTLFQCMGWMDGWMGNTIWLSIRPTVDWGPVHRYPCMNYIELEKKRTWLRLARKKEERGGCTIHQ